MKITIKDYSDIELKYGFRAMMIYENLTEKQFQPKGMADIIIFYYSTLLASQKGCTVTLDEFLDWLDENPNSLAEFTEWLGNIYGVNQKIAPNKDEKKKVSRKRAPQQS